MENNADAILFSNANDVLQIESGVLFRGSVNNSMAVGASGQVSYITAGTSGSTATTPLTFYGGWSTTTWYSTIVDTVNAGIGNSNPNAKVAFVKANEGGSNNLTLTLIPQASNTYMPARGTTAARSTSARPARASSWSRPAG